MSKTKKILFIITQSEMGGAQRFLFNLLSKLSDRYEMLVATGIDGDKELEVKIRNLGIEVTELKYLKRSISPYNDMRACFEIRDLINKFQPNDLFLLSSKAGFIGSLTAYYFLLTTRPRVIYRIGGWTFNDPWNRAKKKLWINLERISAKWKDVIIVNNRHDLEQAQKLGIKPKDKMVLIHNGLDLNKVEFVPRDEARIKLYERISRLREAEARYGEAKARSSGNLPAGRQEYSQANIIIGTVSNLYPAKGIGTLIETAEYFKNNENVAFIVIGDGSERKNLESLIVSRKLQHKVFLVGRIPDAQKLMGAFDLFVLPSLKEGFSWALIEAMSAKLPVIATRVGAVPEIIENGINGFIVEPNNPRQLAAKIKEVLNSDHLYKEFAIRGHQTVLFNFSEDKMVKEIESLL